jgi:hypothetical protein
MVLQKAIVLQDQHDLFSAALLVSKEWHKMAVSASRSLTSVSAKLSSISQADQLAAWVLAHGPRLRQLKVTFHITQGQQQQELTAPVLKALATSAAQLHSLELLTQCKPGSQLPELPGTAFLVASQAHLQHLTLSNFNISATVISTIRDLKQLITLDLSGSTLTDPLIMKFWPSCLPKASKLNLSRATITFDLLPALQSWPSLKELHLQGISISTRHLPSLQGLPLVSLTLCIKNRQSARVVGQWLAASAGSLGSVTILWDAAPVRSTEEDLVAVLSPLATAAPALKELTMHGWEMTHPEVEWLLGSIQQIKALTLINCSVMRELLHQVDCPIICRPPLADRSGFVGR